MTLEQKKYWKLRAALEELLRVEEEDVAVNPLLEEFLDIFARVALSYQVHGAKSMFEQTKMEILKKRGIAILKPRGK